MGYDGSLKFDTAIDEKGFNSGIKKLGSIAKVGLGAVATSVATVTAALGTGLTFGVKYNAQMQNYFSDFKVMLGSAEAATKYVNQLKKMAASTPFEMTDLANASKILLAFGSTAETAQTQLKMLGDISLGNAEKMNTLSTAFGRIQSNGRASMEELNMMIDSGFNPLNIIAKQTGESMEDLRKRVSDGGVSFEEIAEAMRIATSEGGQFYNGMKEASKTLTGQLSTLKDNVNSLLGELTKGLTDKLTNELVPKAIETVDMLTKTFEEEGGVALVEVGGDLISELILGMTKELPKVINAGTDIIGVIVKELLSHKNELFKASIEIVEAIALGFTKFLPKELAQPIEKTIKSLTKSLKNGGLNKALDSTVNSLKNLSNIVGKISKTVLPVFIKLLDFAGDNFSFLAATILSVKAGMLAYSITINAVTKATTLATTATKLFNAVMSLSPVGLVVAGVTALVTVLGVYGLTVEKVDDKTRLLTTTQLDLINGIHEQSEALKELKNTRDENLQGIQSEHTYTSALVDELKSIVDENGKIKSGYEERANVIAGILNEAYGLELQIIDGHIQKYKEFADSIEDVIQKHKAEAIIEANKPVYTEAIQNKIQAEKDLAQAKQDVLTTEGELKRAQEERDKVLQDSSIPEAEQIKRSIELGEKIDDLTTKLDLQKGAYEEAQQTVNDYNQVIQNQEELVGAVAKGGDDLSLAILKNVSDFKTAGNSSKEELAKQRDDARNHFVRMQEIVNNGGDETAKRGAEQAYQLYALTEIEYNKLSGTTKIVENWQKELQYSLDNSAVPSSGKTLANNLIVATSDKLTSGSPIIKSSAEGLNNAMREGVNYNNPYSLGYGVGNNLSLGMEAGIRQGAENIKNAAVAGVQAALNAAKKEAGIKSPSRLFRDEVGRYLALGMGVGFERNIPVKQMTDSMKKAVGDMQQAAIRVTSNIPMTAKIATKAVTNNYTNNTIDYNEIESAQLRALNKANERPILLNGRQINRELRDWGYVSR